MKTNAYSKEEYNAVPVWYCKNCLSLRIKKDEDDIIDEYCDECGSTNIKISTIDRWDKIYEYKYDCKYLDKKNGKENY